MRILTFLLCGALLIVSPARLAASQPHKPNILFILTDQHRQDGVGAYDGSPAITPNLDRMAAEGARFDRAYVAQPVCSPNRSSIITGLYPHSSGVYENKVPLPSSSRTMSEMLKPAGYACGYFGKWHLGRRDAFETMPEYPSDGRGDNHYFGKGDQRRYATDVITEDAVAFIREHQDKPFYTYVSYYPPHPPYSVPPGYEEHYKHIEDRNQRIYYAMCTKIDENVGQLLTTLDDLKLTDRTLVVFTSEHGHYFDHEWNDHDKRLCYDTASRIPLLMRFPGVIPDGQRISGLISSVDLTQTLMELIGQKSPTGLQGEDLSTLARGKTDRGREYIFIENIPYPFNREKGEERCVFDGKWKLILSTKRSPELYDLDSDPTESENVFSEERGNDPVQRLCRALESWSKETKDELTPALLKRLRQQQ